MPPRPKRSSVPHSTGDPVANLIRQGLQYHHSGSLAEAERCYRQALHKQPKHADALHLLGFLLSQQGQLSEAKELINKAIAADSKQPLFWNNLGLVLRQEGKLEEAEQAFRQALHLQPKHVIALCSLADLRSLQQQRAEAISLYRQALTWQENLFEAHSNLGNLLQEEGQLEEAIACYQQALAIEPAAYDACNNMGLARQAQQQYALAEECFRHALRIKADFPAALSNLGNLLQHQHRQEEALACYQQALAIDPHFHPAYGNLGNLLRDQGRLQESIAALQEAVRLQPLLYEGHCNLGTTLVRAGRMQEAIACFQQALAIKPDFHLARSNLGFALQDQGDLPGSIDCYRQVIRQQPQHLSAYGSLLHQALHLGDWQDFAALYERMMQIFHAGQQEINPFFFISLPCSASEQLQCARRWAARYYPPHPPLYNAPPPASRPERLKIGYLSCDFQDHATVQLMAELFELHDRQRFTIIAYSYGIDSNSQGRQRIMAACDRFVDLLPLSHQQAAEQIHADGVHILVEMKGYTKDARLEIPSWRPAPVQIAWLGYPGSIGSSFLDYLISDPFITPPGSEEHFSEKIIRLPYCYQPNDRQRAIAPWQPTRQECGLPERGLIFASFNKTYKIHPTLFSVWMRILAAIPESTLWLWQSNPYAVEYLRRAAEQQGVAGARLQFASFLPTAQHLARYRLVDLVLDTFPCNSHTTGSDALWAGCPMVTCAGESFASRVAGSLLHNVGLAELVTSSLAEYEALVITLAGEPQRLRALRQRLQENLAHAPLFDSPLYTSSLEAAYDAAWQRYQEGLPADHLHLSPPAESTYTARHHHRRQPSPEEQPSVTPIDILQQALALHQSNQLGEAEKLYRQILADNPNHPAACHLYGYLLHQQGDNENAAEWIRKAVVLQADEPLFRNNLGTVLLAMGERQEAVECYRQALAIQPHFAMTLCNLGNVLYDMGETDEALQLYRTAIREQPDFYAAYNSLGNALQKEGNFHEAITVYQQGLRVNPHYPEAYNNMAAALQALQRLDEAIAACRQALEIKPDYPEAYRNLGNILLMQGRSDEAIASYRQALQIYPGYRDAHNNLGNALLGQGKLQEAAASYRQALAISPDLYEAHNNLGIALQEQGQLEEAIACYRQAIALKADYGGALGNLGVALIDQGRLDEAIACYEQAVAAAPDEANHQSALLHQMLHLCDWRQFHSRYEQMIRTFLAHDKECNPFVFLSLPTTPEEQRLCASRFIQHRHPTARNLSAGRSFAATPPRLKIGYLSSDYQNHPVAFLTAELFELHDRSRFEITAYSYGSDDGREMRRRIMAASDHFVDLRPLTYEQAAQRIADDGIHILIELNGFTKDARLQIPAMRPAPIQISWLGYLGSSGSPFIDYILTDSFITPEGYERDFSEKVLRLPECFQPNDRQRTIAPTPTRAQRGLPEQGFLFASFNKSYKFNPDTFAVWMRLLQRTPGSLLWLVASNAWVEENLCRQAEAHGVARQRLFFAPKMELAEYLANYRLVDLVLDTYPYNSGTTASNALWAGCPMLTCSGKTFVSRQAGSLLTHVGLGELVTHSLEEYEELALQLAHDPERLLSLRQRLQKNLASAPLFDSPRFTRHLELAYQTVWQRFSSGAAPEHLTIPALPRTRTAVPLPSARLATTSMITTTPPAPSPASNPLTLSAVELVTLAEQYNAQGNLAAAIELYQQWLNHNESAHIAYAIRFNLGILYQQTGQLAQAKVAWQRVIASHPQFYPAHINLAGILEGLEGAQAAENCWLHLLTCLPIQQTEQQGTLLSACKQIARLTASHNTRLFADGASRAIEGKLSVPELIQLATQLSDQGAAAKMVDLYRIWLTYNANDPLAHAIHFNLGTYLSQGSDLLLAQVAFQEAIRVNPDFYPAYINLGGLLDRLAAPQEAIACWQNVLDRLPLLRGDTIEYKLAALKQIARVSTDPEQAEEVLRQSLEINPRQREIIQQWVNKRQAQCKWPVLEPFPYCSKAQLMQGFAPLSAALYSDDPLWQLANAAHYNHFEIGKPSLTFLDSHDSLLANDGQQPLRIGYLSSDLRDHAVGYLTAEVYELHDRRKVEQFLYYIGIATDTPFHQRIKRAADHWIDLSQLSDEEAARRMVEDRIQILVDLNGYTHSARLNLIAMRPAPIIVNWLGYPGTTGSPYHNYIIADEFIIPQHHELYYSEKVLRLPCYQPNDRKRLLAEETPSRQEAGLPEKAMVYSCLNGAQKITPFIWKLWMEILRQVPESVLWLLNEDEAIRQRLRQAAQQEGISSERLIFAERKLNAEHLVRFPLADLSIDSAPYGSHTTASDALWMGVPVLTLVGLGFAARVCGSLVHAAGLDELICHDAASYVAKAVELGRNREKLLQYRSFLQQNRDRCTLFATPLLVERLEELYAHMWQEYQGGRLPRPDLANLGIYQEIAIERDQGGCGIAEENSYRADYLARLREKNRYSYIRPDNRLWKEKDN
ncbi:tetratricopeptide repeat protein [Candidatus Magnetaquicoccus inordinatus]|uniref:O-linked N-acetylglucosamine transferase family protein n=1 Tax=Candidatus Magnetaquicoccus inordinatus TaxID=2496818 RepID=UPI00102CD982|nr:tetratricopeptide repeat protein [Candidatus Magnetaquicoccus inordinatus]